MYTTVEDTPLVIAAPGVLDNDSDVDGQSLSAILVSPAENGTVTLNANGSFSYSPNPAFNGTDSFTYKVSDGTSESEVAVVTIAVTSVYEPPVANLDAYRQRRTRRWWWQRRGRWAMTSRLMDCLSVRSW